MHEPVQYLQKLIEKAAAHQKKEKLSDVLLKLSGVNVQVPNKPLVSTQQQLGSVEAPASQPLTNEPITQGNHITPTLNTKPVVSTGTNQSHIASSNPMRGSSTTKANSFTSTTKIPNILKTAQGTPPIVPPAAPKPKGGSVATGGNEYRLTPYSNTEINAGNTLANTPTQPGAAGVVDFPQSSQTRGAQPIPTYTTTPAPAAPPATPPTVPQVHRGGNMTPGGNEYRLTPYSNAEINAGNTLANTPTQPGAAGVVDFPNAGASPHTPTQPEAAGVRYMPSPKVDPYTIPQVKDLPHSRPSAQGFLRPLGRKMNAAGALHSAMHGNYWEALKDMAKKEVPGFNTASRIGGVADRLIKKDFTGAALEAAGQYIPLAPTALQYGRDVYNGVQEQAARNNRFTQRNREVRGSLQEYRSTGLEHEDGVPFINTEDVDLLGKLGFDISAEEYCGLEKTSEVLDIYSYIEKVAGVPREVAKLINAGQAFSGEYLKDMGYKLPKGYEVKGDICCPVEKTEQSFQQTEKEKKESFEKTATAWKERLRAGTLSTKSLGRIMNVSSEGNPKWNSLYQYGHGPKNVGRIAPKHVASQEELTQGQHAAELKKFVSNPIYRKGLQYNERFRGDDRLLNGKADPVLQRDKLYGRDGMYNTHPYNPKIEPDNYYTETPTSPDVNAQKRISLLGKGLSQAPKATLYERYKRYMNDRSPITQESLDDTAKQVREYLNSPWAQIGSDTDLVRNNTIKRQLDVRQATPLAKKKIMGSSVNFPKEEYRGKTLPEMMDKITADLRSGSNYSPMAIQGLNMINSPLGTGQGIARHELSHIADQNMSKAEIWPILKQIHSTLKRNPEIMKAVNNGANWWEKDTMLTEAVAQAIASRGGSNSAKRFISQYEDMARNSKNKDLRRILPTVLERDPTGVDQAIITQLMNNYGLTLPRSR